MSPPAALRSLARRIVNDYAGTNRLVEYARLLTAARDAGYELLSLENFHDRIGRDAERETRSLVLRHDVDIRDVAGNRAFWEIEQAIGARSTFYFRLSTVEAHAPLIGQLLRGGFEVGYHFEEGATMAKRLHLGSRVDVLRRRDEIEQAFRENCAAFRRRWNPELRSVASHGDWMNRRLGFANHELLSPRVLEDCGIEFEAYGEPMSRIDVYVSDVARPPERWSRGYGLGDALREARSPIYLLAHERNWHVARGASAQADIARLADAIRYRLGR